MTWIIIGQTIGNAVAENVEQSANTPKTPWGESESDWTTEDTTGETVQNIPVEVTNLPPVSEASPSISQIVASLHGSSSLDPQVVAELDQEFSVTQSDGPGYADLADNEYPGASTTLNGLTIPLVNPNGPQYVWPNVSATPAVTVGGQIPLMPIAEGSAASDNTPVLSDASENAILDSPLDDQQADNFESAVLNASATTGINPNVLVGMALKESSLGAFMGSNATAAKGLFGLEQLDVDFINEHFNSNITTSDILSLDSDSVQKVTIGVAQFLEHYSNKYSNYSDPDGIDVAISVWRVGIGQTRDNIRSGNFWDYVDPHLHESVQHYVDSVERLR